ncbi:hypothetical protein M1293_01715 [Candidatus Parvarchaeota archaeon]|nr:hypothetical protein [Candidatus Parvarchaeota archaeon]
MSNNHFFVLISAILLAIALSILAGVSSPHVSQNSVNNGSVSVPVSCSAYNTDFNYSAPSSVNASVGEVTIVSFYVTNTGNVTSSVYATVSSPNDSSLGIKTASPVNDEAGKTVYYEISLDPTKTGNYSTNATFYSSYQNCLTQKSTPLSIRVINSTSSRNSTVT